MKRALEPTSAFLRAMKRLLKRQPGSAEEIRNVLMQLEADAFAPSLRTHKLKGSLSGCWASSAGYDMRIIFEILPAEAGEKLSLLTIGTHDEVY